MRKENESEIVAKIEASGFEKVANGVFEMSRQLYELGELDLRYVQSQIRTEDRESAFVYIEHCFESGKFKYSIYKPKTDLDNLQFNFKLD